MNINPSFTLFLALASLVSIQAAQFKIKVEAGDASHKDAIVTTSVPQNFPASGSLRSSDGKSIPFQKTEDAKIVFILPNLSNGETKTFEVQSAAAPAAIEARQHDGRVDLKVGDKTIFTYQGNETEFPRPDIKPVYKRGGYIHPLYSPSGKLITDDFPRNHTHHHGIWFPWTKTTFEGRSPDFWNMGEGKGKVEFVKLGQTWSGPVQAGFVAHHRFIDLTSGQPKPALNETWNVAAYKVPGADYYLFDLVSTQTCATASPLELPKYYYGGLGFRGNWDWNGTNNCFFLTANGETNRVKGNETRANWCHIGGLVNGQFTGLAILGHPDNFRAPQPMRLHPGEPFFCFAPSQLGDWSIQPGKPYISRYRFIVKDGKPAKAQLDDLWNEYAHPPKAIVQAF